MHFVSLGAQCSVSDRCAVACGGTGGREEVCPHQNLVRQLVNLMPNLANATPSKHWHRRKSLRALVPLSIRKDTVLVEYRANARLFMMMRPGKAGEAFARCVGDYLQSMGLSVESEYEVLVSNNGKHKKVHRFDWGNESVVVECKAYNWTSGGNIPSAKMSTANEALLYLIAAPSSFRKILFMLETRSRSKGRQETLAEYYVRTYKHLFPEELEVLQLNFSDISVKNLWPGYDNSKRGAIGTLESSHEDDYW